MVDIESLLILYNTATENIQYMESSGECYLDRDFYLASIEAQDEAAELLQYLGY